MGLGINSLNTNMPLRTYTPNFRGEKVAAQPVSEPVDENPISRRGETMKLIKGTFLGGLALGAKVMWEIFIDGDLPIEDAGKAAKKIIDKTKKQAAEDKKLLLYIGGTAALVAAGLSGFALLYTMFNAPKIAYNGKVNNFTKSKEMDVYIKANEAERELYTQINDAAVNDTEDKDKLKEQYMQMKMAKNQVPEFVNNKKKKA